MSTIIGIRQAKWSRGQQRSDQLRRSTPVAFQPPHVHDDTRSSRKPSMPSQPEPTPDVSPGNRSARRCHADPGPCRARQIIGIDAIEAAVMLGHNTSAGAAEHVNPDTRQLRRPAKWRRLTEHRPVEERCQAIDGTTPPMQARAARRRPRLRHNRETDTVPVSIAHVSRRI